MPVAAAIAFVGALIFLAHLLAAIFDHTGMGLVRDTF
jgi:hypothetical protein